MMDILGKIKKPAYILSILEIQFLVMDSKNYPIYYQHYIDKVPEGDPFLLLEAGVKETLRTFAMVSEDKANSSYEEGKWSLKDLLQHMIDTERIFSYRALSFSRGESNKLIGYDHNAYAAEAKAISRSLKELLEELKRLRLSTIDLFKSFSPDMLAKKGNANGSDLSVDQILHILIGHEIHHLEIIHKRYLNA